MAEEHKLNKDTAKQAKHDKQNWKVQKCWKNIRLEESTFTPNFYSMKDISGNSVPHSQKTDAIAEYFHCKEWGPKQNPVPANNQKPQILQNVQAKTGDLEYFEVVKAVKKLKTNKAPGPDGTVTELFKFLDQDNVISLTECLNSLWRNKKVPDEFVQARIASLYKKGDHENPDNYRRISVLNMSYKTFPSILKLRLAEGLEQHISPTQFGFREGRSTVDPLFCIRRLTDRCLRTR